MRKAVFLVMLLSVFLLLTACEQVSDVQSGQDESFTPENSGTETGVQDEAVGGNPDTYSEYGYVKQEISVGGDAVDMLARMIIGSLLISVPSNTSIKVFDFVNISPSGKPIVEDVGYYNFSVSRNSDLKAKTFIGFSARFTSTDKMKNDAGETIPILLMSGDMSQPVAAPITNDPASGLVIFTFCGGTKPACRSSERINKTINNVRVFVDESDAEAGIYNGTVTLELIASP